MRIFNNLIQALRGLKLNRGNTLLMTLGVMGGIASLTVIVAIGFGIKAVSYTHLTLPTKA